MAKEDQIEMEGEVIDTLREFIHHVFDHSERELTTGRLLDSSAALDAVTRYSD